MKHLLLIVVFSQLSLSAQDSLYIRDTVWVSGDFTVPHDAFTSLGKLEYNELREWTSHSLWGHYLTPKTKSPKRSIKDVYVTAYLKEEFLFSEDYEVYDFVRRFPPWNGDMPCLYPACYYKYLYEHKTKHFWRGILHEKKRRMYIGQLEYVDLSCEFKCYYIGKHKIKTVNPRARNRKRAYTVSMANVYIIVEVNKAVLIPY